MEWKEKLDRRNQQKRERLIKTAVSIVKRTGKVVLDRQTICDKSAIAVGSLNYHFGNMDSFKDSLYEYCYKQIESGHINKEYVLILMHATATGKDFISDIRKALNA